MKKFDLSVFGEALGGIAEKVERARGAEGTDSSLFSAQVETMMRTTVLSGTRRPTAQRITEAITWALNRHESPVTIMPPDINLKIERLVFELKTPSTIQRRERSTILNAGVQGLHVTVNISQSSSNAGGTSKDTNATIGGSKKRGFASLSGALVQFRLVAKQASLAISVPAVVIKPATDETTAAVEALRGGLPAYSAEDTASLRRSTSTNSLQSGSESGLSTHGMPTNPVVATSATAASTAGATRMPPKTPDRVRTSNGNDPNTAQERGPFTINTPVDEGLHVLRTTQASESQGLLELREIISSAPAENVFVFCVILDLDDKGEGAGDVQIALGGLRMDFSKRTLAAIVHPNFSETLRSLLSDMSLIFRILPFLSAATEKSVLIDWQELLPYVVVTSDPPVALLDRLAQQLTHQLLRRQQQQQQQESTTTGATTSARNRQSHGGLSRKSSKRSSMGASSSNVIAHTGSSAASKSSSNVLASATNAASTSARGRSSGKAVESDLQSVMIGDLSLIEHELETQNVSVFDQSLSILDEEEDDDHDEDNDDSSDGDSQNPRGEDDEPNIVRINHHDEDDMVHGDDQHLPGSYSDEEDEEEFEEEDAEEEMVQLPRDSPESLAARKQRRAAIVFNKNLMQWLGTLEALLPRVVSLCVRTSPIVLQTLEAAILRDLVYAKIHAVLDQAANRGNGNNQRPAGGFFGATSTLFAHDSVWGILGHLILASVEPVSGGNGSSGGRPRGYTTFTGVR